MKTLIKNTIISQAITLGFDFSEIDESIEFSELNEKLLDFFIKNSDKLPQLEDECEVTGHCNSQNVSYGDFSSDGEIVHFSDHWQKAPETKIFHSEFLMEENGLMKKMRLFYLVGETDYNAPFGYFYDKKQKKHVKEEEKIEL